MSGHIRLSEFLLSYLNQQSINQNVIHGDPKLSNFLFDNQFKYVISLIDLDTVSSGFLLTDLADCIRSICNVACEDPKDIDDVHFDFLIRGSGLFRAQGLTIYDFEIGLILIIVRQVGLRPRPPRSRPSAFENSAFGLNKSAFGFR